MQRSLKTRLETLEQKKATDVIEAIFIQLVSPGGSGPVHHDPIAVRKTRGDWRLDRNPGEGVEDFRQRAYTLCPRAAQEVPLLMEVYQ